MKLLVYPDPILTQVSERVTEFDRTWLQETCDELYAVMVESNGVGLSAVQVGLLKRIVVMEVPNSHRWTLINPEIVAADGQFVYSEGCLSVPGYYEDRERFDRIALDFQDIKGDHFREEFEDIEAFCIQHELDHLEGKLFIDDLSPLKKERVRKKIQKTLRTQDRK